MASIFRKVLNPNQRLFYALKQTYGLGFFKISFLLKKYGVYHLCLVKQVPEIVLSALCKEVESFFLADIDLKKDHMAHTHKVANFKNHHGMFLRILLKKKKDEFN